MHRCRRVAESDRGRLRRTRTRTSISSRSTSPLVEELAKRLFALPGVVERPSGISVPGARALTLAPGEPAGPPEAFMIDREFAHLHPAPDHSLHAMLPAEVAQAAIDAGWAELHPVARMGPLALKTHALRTARGTGARRGRAARRDLLPLRPRSSNRLIPDTAPRESGSRGPALWPALSLNRWLEFAGRLPYGQKATCRRTWEYVEASRWKRPRRSS